MSNRESCPTLTEEGRHLLEQDIKKAVTKFVIYGAKKDNPTEAQELLKLIENKQVTSEMLERYLVVSSSPISGFFDVDGKLTYMFQVAYTDIKEELRGKIAIYGIALLNEEGKIVTLYPDDGIILDGDQANYRGTIKIHSVVGTPGTVTYYTGEYITREEYEAAKVPMVEKVLDETGKRFKPLLDNAITDFENQTTHQLATQQNDFEQFKASAQRQLDLIQAQATADLDGMQEFVVKLVQMARLEGYFDQSLHIIENSLARFSKKLDKLLHLLIRIDEELNQLGTLGVFPHVLPEDYIAFNVYYKKADYRAFLKKATDKALGSYIKENYYDKSMFKFEYRFYVKTGKYPDAFYIKFNMNPDKLNVFNPTFQSLPPPYRTDSSGYNNTELRSDWWGTGATPTNLNIDNWGHDVKTAGRDLNNARVNDRNWLGQWLRKTYRDIPGQNGGEFWNKLYQYQIDLGRIVKYFGEILNDYTYTENRYDDVNPTHITYIIGMKAKLSFDFQKELAEILDEPTYVY